MSVAGGEKATRLRKARILLRREAQFPNSLVEPPPEEMRRAYDKERRADPGPRAEAEGGFRTLNRKVGLARPKPKDAADVPAAREIRVERQCTVHELDHRVDILAEPGQSNGGIRQDSRIVTCYLEGSPGEISTLTTVRRRIFAPIVVYQPLAAGRGPGECRPVTRIPCDRLLQKAECVRDLLCRRPDQCVGAQVKVVRGKIGGRAAGGTCGFGRL